MPDSFLKQQCRTLSTLRKSAVVALVLADEDDLERTHCLSVQKCLEGRSFDAIDFLLHSGGGDINAAYQIAEMLRSRSKAFRVIVPYYAKSAATLFTLAADEITMGELAELGPLDAQVPESHRGSWKYSSALNPFKSLAQLENFASTTFDRCLKLLANKADTLTLDDRIVRATEYAAAITRPLFSNLDIEKLGTHARSLAVGRAYGDRLLRRYTKLKSDQKAREAVLKKLVYDYPSHGYIIDLKEMQELGFEVRGPSAAEQPVIDAVAHYLADEPSSEIFCVCEATQQTPDDLKAHRRRRPGPVVTKR